MSTYLTDGFSTTFSFSLGAVNFKEKTVTPPSIEGGGKNDTTTMRSVTWRNFQPKKLKTMGEMKGTCQYDPIVYQNLVTFINQVQLITLNFPDGSTLLFWGWLDEFKPQEAKEGEMPLADFTVQCSNQDATGNNVAPVFVP